MTAVAASDQRSGRRRRFGLPAVSGSAFVLPGVVWLALFFIVPLAFIFVVSLGSRNELNQIVLDNPRWTTTRRRSTRSSCRRSSSRCSTRERRRSCRC